MVELRRRMMMRCFTIILGPSRSLVVKGLESDYQWRAESKGDHGHERLHDIYHKQGFEAEIIVSHA